MNGLEDGDGSSQTPPGHWKWASKIHFIRIEIDISWFWKKIFTEWLVESFYQSFLVVPTRDFLYSLEMEKSGSKPSFEQKLNPKAKDSLPTLVFFSVFFVGCKPMYKKYSNLLWWAVCDRMNSPSSCHYVLLSTKMEGRPNESLLVKTRQPQICVFLWPFYMATTTT